MWLVLAALLAGLTGCSGPGCGLVLPVADNDSIHYVVLGLGVVSVPKPAGETAVLATKLDALGLSISDQPGGKLGLGYTSASVVAIPDKAENIQVEISQKPGGPLTVVSPKAFLRQQ